ncbi:MAG: ROK family protein, partial [Candidatus Omnitrophica bacterium]|nr:ROK family protein [Candidatus Omnitrophota bacterium]
MFSALKLKLGVKVIAVVIIQSFLIFDLAFAANGKIYITENNYLSPTLQINNADFRGAVGGALNPQPKGHDNSLLELIKAKPAELGEITLYPKHEELIQIGFPTAGWRSKFPEYGGMFSKENVYSICQAGVEYMNDKKSFFDEAGLERAVVIAHDTRNHMAEFAREVATIFASNGIKVYLVDDFSSSPVNVFILRKYNASLLINLTASHNGPEYGGFEFFDGRTLGLAHEDINASVTGALSKTKEVKYYKDINAPEVRENIEKVEVPLKEYVTYLQTELGIDFDIIKQQKPRLINDCQYGTSVLMKKLAKIAGLQDYFRFIHDEPRADMGGLKNSETLPENLAELSQEVVKQKADAGTAQDTDGDRFGLILENGKWLSPNQFFSLLTYSYLKTESQKPDFDPKKYVVIRTIPSTGWVDKIAAHFGIPAENVWETPVGFRWVNAAIHKARAEGKIPIIAFEESGGASILDSLPYKDGIAVAFKFLEITARLKKEGKDLSSLYNELEQVIGKIYSNRDNPKLEIASKSEIADNPKLAPVIKKIAELYQGKNGKIMSHFREFAKNLTPGSEINLEGEKFVVTATNFADGVKIAFKGGAWVCIRPSGTEPVFRVYTEAYSEKERALLAQWFLKDIEKFADEARSLLPRNAEDFMREIDFITRVLGAEGSYPTVVEVWKRATDVVALIKEYSKVSGKTVETVLQAFDANDFLKTLSALYRVRTAGVLDASEYEGKTLEISVTNEKYQGTNPQKDAKGQPLSEYLRLMRQIAPNVPNIFRDGMEGFVGTFLGMELEKGKAETPDLKSIVERLKTFLAKVDLKNIRYIVTYGIGANEMYSHQLARAMNAFFKFMGLDVQWIVVNNPEHLGIIPKNANNENTIVFEMSRSGKTGETRDFFNATKGRFKTRIVAANGEALFNLAKKLEKAGGKVLVIDDTPGHIGGRQMNRKTLMVYAPLFVALAGGLKDINQAEEYLAAYTSSLLSANNELDYGKGLGSHGVAAAEFLLRQRESGRSKFAVLFDDTLYPASKELGQLINEGGNKIIAGGANFNILDSYSLNKDRDLVDMVAEKAPQSQVFVALLNKNAPEYKEHAAYIEQLNGKGIPVIVISIDLRKDDLKYSLQAIARLSALLQDMTVYFTNITQQSADANPSVKLVREITAAMTALIKEKVAAGETDLTLTAGEVFNRITQTQQKGRIDAKGKLDKLGVTRTEFNQAFEQFRSAITGLAQALGISESKATFIYMSAIADVVKTDMSEPGKLHGSQEVEEAFSRRTGLAATVNTLAPAQQPISLNKEVVLETTNKSRVSVFADDETLGVVNQIQGNTAERIAEYLFKMWQTGRYDMRYMPLAFPEAERDNSVIAELRRFIVEKFGDLDVTSPQCPFPNAAHTGFESIVSHPLKVFYFAVAYTDTYGKDGKINGTSEVEPGVTVDKAAYVYNLANDYRAPYGGSPSVVFSVNNGKELENVKSVLSGALDLFRKKIDTYVSTEGSKKKEEKKLPVSLNDRETYRFVSISMGGDKVAISVNDGYNNIIDHMEVRWNDVFAGGAKNADAEAIMSLVAENINRLLERNQVSAAAVNKVSSNLCGPVDKEKGIFGSEFPVPNLPIGDKYPFRAQLQQKLSVYGIYADVEMVNDAEGALKGETYSPKGALRDYPDGGVTINGGGANSAVKKNGEFYAGDKGELKEFGHNLVRVKGKDDDFYHYQWVGEKALGRHPIEVGNSNEEIIRKSGDMGRAYVANPAKFVQDNPDYPLINWAQGDRDYEDRTSGPSIDRILARTGFKGYTVKNLTEKAANGDQHAINWIKGIGHEVGQAHAALFASYPNEGFIKHWVLISGVN